MSNSHGAVQPAFTNKKQHLIELSICWTADYYHWFFICQDKRWVSSSLLLISSTAFQNTASLLTAQTGHLLAIEQSGDKSETFFHDITLLPRHGTFSRKGRKCYPCLRKDVLPMCRVGHKGSMADPFYFMAPRGDHHSLAGAVEIMSHFGWAEGDLACQRSSANPGSIPPALSSNRFRGSSRIE